MTYYGVVLLLSGWQADESRYINEVTGIIDKVEKQYPGGALWILNRVRQPTNRLGFERDG